MRRSEDYGRGTRVEEMATFRCNVEVSFWVLISRDEDQSVQWGR